MIKPHTIFTVEQKEILRSSKYDMYAEDTKNFAEIKAKQKHYNLRKLHDFIFKWREKYQYFCEIFDCKSWIVEEPYIPFKNYGDYRHSYDYQYMHKVEYYVYGFFDSILTHKARYEEMMRREISSYAVYQEDILKDRYFELISYEHYYRLYIRMCPALICSLILSMSDNPTIMSWYGKSSKFKGFIKDLANTCGCIEFSNNRISLVTTEYPLKTELQIDIGGYNTFNGFPDDRCGKHVYFVRDNEVVSITENITYNHLDDLFGKGRTKPLTSEDLELYHMINGKYPIMYDFDVQC